MESSQDTQLQVLYKSGTFDLHESAKPTPGPGQALIRVHYSTVNPYDRIMSTVNKDEGFILGCDGCGVIDSVGEGVDAGKWVGKKVAFLGNGYSRWAVKEIDMIVPFADAFDLKQGANTYVNPFTVTAMYDYASKIKAKAVILLAASSALSKMMIRLCQQKGEIETVSIVRKDDQIRDLKVNFGATYVLNQTSPTFFTDLEAVIKQTTPTVLFECLGGDLPGDIFLRMPAKSHMVVYGNLTKQRVSFEPQEFHWSDKHISGLMMYRWVTSLDQEERERWFKIVAEDLEQGGKIFGSKIIKEVPLREWRQALSESESEASTGKYLINCKDA